jgi:hypothetical protein
MTATPAATSHAVPGSGTGLTWNMGAREKVAV